MIGIILGAIFGGVQLYLLMLGVGVAGGKRLKIWALVVQFFCPMAGLLLCAALQRTQLLRCAVAMSAVLVAGAVVCFLYLRRRESNRRKKD